MVTYKELFEKLKINKAESFEQLKAYNSFDEILRTIHPYIAAHVSKDELIEIIDTLDNEYHNGVRAGQLTGFEMGIKFALDLLSQNNAFIPKSTINIDTYDIE